MTTAVLIVACRQMINGAKLAADRPWVSGKHGQKSGDAAPVLQIKCGTGLQFATFMHGLNLCSRLTAQIYFRHSNQGTRYD